MNFFDLIRAQRTIGALVFGGLGVFCLGVLCWATSAATDEKFERWGGFIFLSIRTIPFLVMVLGAAIFVGGVIFALGKTQDTYHGAPEQTIHGAYIIATLAEREGIQVFDPEEADPHETTFYVQVALPDGGRAEFKTSQVVFLAIGEGTRCELKVQGNWLLGYQMLPPLPRT